MFSLCVQIGDMFVYAETVPVLIGIFWVSKNRVFNAYLKKLHTFPGPQSITTVHNCCSNTEHLLININFLKSLHHTSI